MTWKVGHTPFPSIVLPNRSYQKAVSDEQDQRSVCSRGWRGLGCGQGNAALLPGTKFVLKNPLRRIRHTTSPLRGVTDARKDSGVESRQRLRSLSHDNARVTSVPCVRGWCGRPQCQGPGSYIPAWPCAVSFPVSPTGTIRYWKAEEVRVPSSREEMSPQDALTRPPYTTGQSWGKVTAGCKGGGEDWQTLFWNVMCPVSTEGCFVTRRTGGTGDWEPPPFQSSLTSKTPHSAFPPPNSDTPSKWNS